MKTSVLMMTVLLMLAGCTRPVPAPSPPPVLTGQFTYLADAAGFTDCADGRRYPVAMEGAYLELERSYLAVRSRPGLPLLVELEGAIEDRPAMEGDGLVPTLVVARFRGAFPGETCGNPHATSTLAGSYWKLTRLGGQPVQRVEGRREPHLIFRTAEQQVSGSTGCNALHGGYQIEGRRLTLGQLGATLMACPQGADQERRFLDALGRVARWRITGTHLELLDEAGAVLARFEDTPLR